MKRRQYLLLVVLKLLLCLLVTFSLMARTSDKGMLRKEMQTEQRIALVIGNSDYESRPLRNPVNDANAMGAALRQCGFQVIEKTDWLAE